MRAARVGITDVGHDAEQSVLIELVKLNHFRVNAKVVVDSEHLFCVDRNLGPGAIVRIVGERDQGI